MEKVVYLLGAGFSAPLGFPVMSNFIEKSKDLYSQNRQKYEYFERVFTAINEMSIAGSYYKADFFNIEEILSILEMRRQLDSRETTEFFSRYIIDVIKSFTPSITTTLSPSKERIAKWQSRIFGGRGLDQIYGYFVASLLHLMFEQRQDTTETPYMFKYSCQQLPPDRFLYSVITLNYDLVLETYANHVATAFAAVNDIGFSRTLEHGISGPCLAKLHGSVDTGVIVPPTWNKYLHDKISLEWKLAYRLLSEANHIRIIGYSLPESDAYVRYLLKSAIIDTLNLKSLDVLCRDAYGQVRKRFDAFMSFPKYRFVEGDVIEYLASIRDSMSGHSYSKNDQFTLEFPEDMHEEFISKAYDQQHQFR